MKSTFQKILDEELKKVGIQSQKDEFQQTSQPQMSEEFLDLSYIMSDIMSDFTHKNSFHGSLYIRYQKTPGEIQKERNEREKQSQEAFLASLPSENLKTAAQFFFRYGARKFITRELSALKKDFRAIAQQVHPDHFHSENESIQRHFQREFQSLLQNFETLKTHFSFTK